MENYKFFTTKEIRPLGWIKRQLELEAKGLTGNLDKVWPDVRDSAWIGGEKEGWERVPYWLDGFIPLAYLLDNEDMKERAKKYIDAIISKQQESGWICPCDEEDIPKYDTWGVELFSKILTVYFECSGDERVPEVLYKALKNFYDLLKTGQIKLFDWAERRWFETFIGLNFLYERNPEPWMKELAKILKEQGTDYEKFKDRWTRPINEWTMETHVVNLAMMLKYEAVSCELLEEPYLDKASELLEFLFKYNGMPVGIFTGDECLSGLSPIQGVELCAVVEIMYSYEQLFAGTGNVKWLDLLELVAFNALPATYSDDMWAHQYVQMSNQISTEKFPGRSLFRTNGPEAHMFGLEPNYGCCTANGGQGFPKLALSIFMKAKDGIVITMPLASELNWSDGSIEIKSDYPFEDSACYIVRAKEDFNLYIRIPGEADLRKYEIKKGEKKEISHAFSFKTELVDRPYSLKTVKRGSIIYSLPIAYEEKKLEYERDGVERKFPYCDYEYIPKSKWNYGLSRESLEDSLKETVRREERIESLPFDSKNPPLKLKVRVKEINWGLEDGFRTVCAKIPEETEPAGLEETVDFVPYGCAKLRITELPVC